MNFKDAMEHVAHNRTVKVTPLEGQGCHPHLIRVDFHPDLDGDCLQCVCLTKDGQHIEPGETWEPVCYLLCFEDFIDGKWELVNADDYTYDDGEEDE